MVRKNQLRATHLSNGLLPLTIDKPGAQLKHRYPPVLAFMTRSALEDNWAYAFSFNELRLRIETLLAFASKYLITRTIYIRGYL
jgi:hypothetical protein